MYFAFSRNRLSRFLCVGRNFFPGKAFTAVSGVASGAVTVCESVFRSRSNSDFLQSDSNGGSGLWENLAMKNG